jgi:hypothetical protein
MGTVPFAVGDRAGPSDDDTGSASTATLVKSPLASNPGRARVS